MGSDKDATSPKPEDAVEPVPPEYSIQHAKSPGEDSVGPVPTYSEHDNLNSLTVKSTLGNEITQTVDTPAGRASRETIRQVQHDQKSTPEADASTRLFAAIDQGNQERIGQLIAEGNVTANTRRDEETPLLRAVKTKNVQIVQQLLDTGAEPDAFGAASTLDERDIGTKYVLRTPLQLAASEGHFILVKLFMEQYHCDDSLVAPDGQIALRLAAENGHREIVDYLPSRRNGGFKRWQFKNRKSLRRIKSLLANIGWFVKFFVWDIEKFFFWTVPEHVIIRPVVKCCKWCWKNRKGFGKWCKHQVTEAPGRIKRAGIWAGKTIMKIPKGVVTASKGLWKFGTETLPKWIKRFGAWLWRLLTEKLPKALKLLRDWFLTGITSVSKTMWKAVLKVVSFLSTILEAVISFFRALTLKDIWNGFVEVLKVMFITFPKVLWSWIDAFGETSYRMLKALFGSLGQLLWILGLGVLWVVTFLPRQLWKILLSMGESFGKAGYEVKVWLNPKAR
ncbi:hypothetical protein VTL71DRAFT_12209 [Oculimacula yallundae]|uniref:Ankyrin n=1 Tax=Oculimacula yallundae TaxID=86028 RepID=A0ABR4CSC5_9HELO